MFDDIRLAYISSDISKEINTTVFPCAATLDAIFPRNIDFPTLVPPANKYRALPLSKNPPANF